MDSTTWTRDRNHLAEDLLPSVQGQRKFSVSVVVPALNEAASIERVVRPLSRHLREGFIDELLVVDGGSSDETVAIAEACGANVVSAAAIYADLGSPQGKGDSMWRALDAVSGDIVVYFDADLVNFDATWASALAAPLQLDDSISFVKSTFDRPFVDESRSSGEEAGRITQMAAKPLIAMFFPELSVFHQPLSGQIAARRVLLESLRYTSHYGVDIGLLIDTFQRVGLDGMAQVDLGTIHNRHRGIDELSEMATQIYKSVFNRLAEDGRYTGDLSESEDSLLLGDQGLRRTKIALVDRPPMESFRGMNRTKQH